MNGRLIAHDIEGQFILTDEPAPLRVRYIRRVLDVPTMANSPLFIDALTTNLAMRISHWMTGKANFMATLKDNYQEIMTQARLVESAEGSHPEQYANAYDDARYIYSGEHRMYEPYP